jgi:hypothetical protein
MSIDRPLPDLRHVSIFEVQALIRIYIEEMHQMVTPKPTFVSEPLRSHAKRILELLGELP